MKIIKIKIFLILIMIFINDDIIFYKKLCLFLIDGYQLIMQNAFIKIQNKIYTQKQGVIMGDSSAPMISNLVILIHIIQNKIHLNNDIIKCIRMIDDTLMIVRKTTNINNNNVDELFAKYHPKHLQFTVNKMNKNEINFLIIILNMLFNINILKKISIYHGNQIIHHILRKTL